MKIAADHLRAASALIADGLRLMDRHPDTAAQSLRDAQQRQLLVENILLRLRLGEFSDE